MALRLIVSLIIASCRFHLTLKCAIAQKLLNYMNEKNIKSTFFVVGSRALEYPQLLVEEYMAGHEISVHTWAHPVRQFRVSAKLMQAQKLISSFSGSHLPYHGANRC